MRYKKTSPNGIGIGNENRNQAIRIFSGGIGSNTNGAYDSSAMSDDQIVRVYSQDY
jgi:hypothetical protein